jgi:predicted alpha/beta-hydrolase family hydrolase
VSEGRFAALDDGTEVSFVLDRPASARWLYVFGHGAGAGMHHHFMESMTARFAACDIAVLRYQFPYMEAGRRGPDPARRLEETVSAAFRYARARAGGIPVVAGGKSMGGRMTSRACSRALLEGVAGLVFLGFPLHAPGKAGVERADHLRDVSVPMLFVQGTRDRLADLDLMSEVWTGLGKRASTHIVDGGDHSFDVLKRSGRSRDEVLDEIAGAVAGWLKKTLPA